MRGWHNESYRHALASRGIKTTPITRVIQNSIRRIGLPPYDINDGYCDEFLQIVLNEFPEASWRTSESYNPELPIGHVWIYYNGNHYDAETIEGVDSPLNLKIFKRYFKQNPHARNWYKGVVFD